MKATFIETSEFTQWVKQYLADESYAEIQQELMANPEKGVVISGCGGLRKLRITDPSRNKGKRGGARLIYLHVPEASQFLLIDIFDKDQKTDLTKDEKGILAKYAEEFKQKARLAVSKRKREER